MSAPLCGRNIQSRLRIGKNLDNNYNTNADNFKGNSNKNKMVNKENSDHNTRKEENKNNSQKITFAQS